MASFIIAGVILSILSGVAFSPLPNVIDPFRPFSHEASRVLVDWKVQHLCFGEQVRNFIFCEIIPGRLKMNRVLQKLLILLLQEFRLKLFAPLMVGGVE